jgi:hypothetical protein
MLPILLFRPNDASEMAKRWFKSHDSLGGTGKAEDAKTPGAGIIPKLSPRKCVEEMEGGSNRPIGVRERLAHIVISNDRGTRMESERLALCFFFWEQIDNRI